MLPVIIQDLIDKMLDKTKHVEKRQHYATTLRGIVQASQKALDQFDKEWKNK